MKSNHTAHEFDFRFTHRLEIDFSPSLRSFVMGLFEDLSAKIDEAKQASLAEHDEVMAALAAHTGDVTSDPTLNLTADQKTQIMSKMDDLTSTVKGVFDASTTGTTGTTGTTDVTGTTGTTDTTPPPGVTGTPDVTGTVPPPPGP